MGWRCVGNFIYATRGGGSDDFFRYDIAANRWISLHDAPGNVADGGALAADGTFVYAFQGRSSAFWRYDIAADRWTILAPYDRVTDQGGALVFVPGTNPQGRFTSLTASRSLVNSGDTVTVTLDTLLDDVRHRRHRRDSRHDADGRRVVQQPHRADADER